MNVYSVLLVAATKKESQVLMTQYNDIPSVKMDGSKYSYDIARNLFSDITGISKEWNTYFQPSGTLEENESVYIVYSVYLPDKHSIKEGYKWVSLNEIDVASFPYKLIRFAVRRK